MSRAIPNVPCLTPSRRRVQRSNAFFACMALLVAAMLAWTGPASAAGDQASGVSKVLSGLSSQARQVHAWVVDSGDQHGMPFALIDKAAARLHLFDATGALRASSPVLLGLARGDHSVPGIGERNMSDIRPDERTTPAGRFVSEPGQNLRGEDIVWIEYDTAVSLHRVRAHNKAERRLQRLSSVTVADNRISYGCVNVPAGFYDRYVSPVWGRKAAVVYVLPETASAADFFGFDAEAYR